MNKKLGSGKAVLALAAAVVAMLLLMVIPAFGAAAVPPADATTATFGLLGSNNYCTRSCGNISIPYPFGIEPGCYHAAGFNLTCKNSSHHHQPPKLFLGDALQVFDISIPNATVRISVSPKVIEIQHSHGSLMVNRTWGVSLAQHGSYPFFLSDSYNMVLVVLSWVIANHSCPTITANVSAPECLSTHSSCQNTLPSLLFFDGSGYTCQCSHGYQGNPYVADGPDACQDIDECTTPESYSCYGECKNTPGSFLCMCPAGYKGNASVPNGCRDINECANPEAHSCYGTCQNYPGGFHCQCPNGTYGNPHSKDGCITIQQRKNSFTGLSIGLGLGGGTSLLLALGAPFITRKIKLQKVKKMREKIFKQNHGLLLQQLISHNADIGERMIITLRDLEKATNNFDNERVIGGGGHGTVFKGIIDLQVVAIKKSRIVVQREIGEFINEVAILSQVNHRNVVKLFGCCLEAEVPLLIYEFISNGTLYQHLHVEGPISLPWVDRIRIALEVARAISYLHSATSIPIFHRDIKSSNILLDDRLTAKVSDFGASRYIPIDQTEITTAIQGTIGYLDPMYYYTGRLTDKSDVFSFGVLLIELLTRKKPFLYRSNDNDSLVSHFEKLLAQGNLFSIIDPQVMEDEDGEVQEVATLASVCTKLRGEDRPAMREVEMALENLLSKKQIPPCNTAPRPTEDETIIQDMHERITNEASRQYSMEEEIILSASYAR